MKKTITILFCVLSLFMIQCTGGKKNETFTSGKEIQFKVNGNIISIIVPDSLKGNPEITEQSWGATEIKIGTGFQISIKEEVGDISLTKSDIAGNEVNKLKHYIKDEPSFLFWESQITSSEFHFYLIQKVGATSYVVNDIPGDMFKQSEIQIMSDAAKTIKAIDTKPNP